MKPILRIFVIGLIFGMTSIAWLILGAVMNDRSSEQRWKLQESVSELWGQPQAQRAPVLDFHWNTQREVEREETVGKHVRKIREIVTDHHQKRVEVDSTKLDVTLSLDQRLKGLMWYSLYDVALDGQWSYVHQADESGDLFIAFTFPDANGLYDNFRFILNGKPLELTPQNGTVTAKIEVAKGDEIDLRIGYLSRGMDSWTYVPSDGVASLQNFAVKMKTDFTEIDFPGYTMSPSSKMPIENGWALDWSFKQVITGYKIGMVMPKKIQPGELASSLSFSAPISLLFFFLMIWVFATLRKIEIHPINYFFLGSAFFAFHLLFSYSVDHLTVLPAFVLASVVSILLVVSYLRLVVSNRFAFVEAAMAQMVYLIGFSMAHFWEGFTGLTVTCLSIFTLFILMQLTGRIRWTEVLTIRRNEEGRVSPS
jgi:inner membrane protein involved in colicin E2 resistance